MLDAEGKSKPRPGEDSTSTPGCRVPPLSLRPGSSLLQDAPPPNPAPWAECFLPTGPRLQEPLSGPLSLSSSGTSPSRLSPYVMALPSHPSYLGHLAAWWSLILGAPPGHPASCPYAYKGFSSWTSRPFLGTYCAWYPGCELAGSPASQADRGMACLETAGYRLQGLLTQPRPHAVLTPLRGRSLGPGVIREGSREDLGLGQLVAMTRCRCPFPSQGSSLPGWRHKPTPHPWLCPSDTWLPLPRHREHPKAGWEGHHDLRLLLLPCLRRGGAGKRLNGCHLGWACGPGAHPWQPLNIWRCQAPRGHHCPSSTYSIPGALRHRGLWPGSSLLTLQCMRPSSCRFAWTQGLGIAEGVWVGGVLF